MGDGPPIRVDHIRDPAFGWTFSSPDVEGMVGGGETLRESTDRAEFLVRTHLISRAEPDPRGRTAGTVRFEHVVDRGADESAGTGPIRPPF